MLGEEGFRVKLHTLEGCSVFSVHASESHDHLAGRSVVEGIGRPGGDAPLAVLRDRLSEYDERVVAGGGEWVRQPLENA